MPKEEAMKRILSIVFVLAVSLGLVVVAQTPIPVLAASVYEYYNTGDNNHVWLYGSTWVAQTFTPSAGHTITSVKLKLSRNGAPGTVTTSIKATIAGQPTGSDLCSGTTSGDTLTASAPGEWREITLGSGYGLSAGTTYAIVVRATGGDSSNYLWWRVDGSSPTYGGGMYLLSFNSGSSWTSGASYDLMFEEWGDPPVGWETYPVSKARVLLPWIGLSAAIVAGASLLVFRRRRTIT
jgi:hypothetical protein